jgi:predicted nucleotidyltransferase
VSRIAASLEAVAQILGKGDRRWALVGALAVSARTEPRFTRDIDVAVAVASDADAEQVVGLFRQAGHRVFALVEQEAKSRLATARLMAPAEGDSASMIVDLLFASSGVEAEVVGAAENLEVLPGLWVPVARAGHLLALKTLSRGDHRPQDSADIRALLREMSEADRARARLLVALIVERGFARGKELDRELEALIG